MPGGDGTGPLGNGPRSGRRFGKCAGGNGAGGWRNGPGGGARAEDLGLRRRRALQANASRPWISPATPPPAGRPEAGSTEDLRDIVSQVEHLQQALDDLRLRIERRLRPADPEA